MKSLNIKLEKNVMMPNKYGANYQDFEQDTIDVLRDMKVGDSFTVKNYGDVSRLRKLCKFKLKKLVSSRKEYIGKTKNDGHVFRIWCTRILSDNEHQKEVEKFEAQYQNKKLHTAGMLAKHETSDTTATNHNDYRAKIDGMILAIAEYREENRMLVDDIEHIKKILTEELGYSDERASLSRGVNND
jgi:hypothetical protein